MSDVAYVYTPIERTSRRLGLFLLIVIGLTLTMMLFFIKTRAQDARAEVISLEAQIEDHEAAITVLLAEKAVLANPDRLRRLSAERLSLEPIANEAVADLIDLADPDKGRAP